MKKLFAWMSVLCSLLSFTGCIFEENELDNIIQERRPEILEEYGSNTQKWDSFTFKSLTGKQDLIVTRTSKPGEPLAISTTPYAQKALVVAVYQTDCASCQLQAPWLDMLAEEFAPNYGVDFVIIFLDIFENSDAELPAWMSNITHVDSFSNVQTACVGGACKQVFAPYFKTTTKGTVYFVNKQSLFKNHQENAWDTDNPQQAYITLRTHLAEFLKLTPIKSTAEVDDWESNESVH